MARLCRAAFVCALALTVGSSAFAGCLPDSPRAVEAMACCQSGDHDCGPAMRTAADCCRSSAPADAKFAAAKPAAPAKPAVTRIATVVPLDARAQVIASVTLVASVAASPPLFLLASSLRI